MSSGRKEGFSDDEKKSLRSEIYQLLKTVYQLFDEVIPIANRVAWFVSYVLFEIGDKSDAFIALASNCDNIGTIDVVKIDEKDLTDISFDEEDGDTSTIGIT